MSKVRSVVREKNIEKSQEEDSQGLEEGNKGPHS
jgi:hypothetical protein